MAEPKPLTARERRDLNAAVRHLGRAMRALDRAGVPDPTIEDPGWRWDIQRSIRVTAQASDHLIDALEGENGTTP